MALIDDAPAAAARLTALESLTATPQVDVSGWAIACVLTAVAVLVLEAGTSRRRPSR